MQKPKIQKSARRKCRSLLNHKRFQNPLDVFYKPMGTINIRIRNQIYKKSKTFFEIMKTRGIEKIKPLVKKNHLPD